VEENLPKRNMGQKRGFQIVQQLSLRNENEIKRQDKKLLLHVSLKINFFLRLGIHPSLGKKKRKREKKLTCLKNIIYAY